MMTVIEPLPLLSMHLDRTGEDLSVSDQDCIEEIGTLGIVPSAG